MSAASRTGPQVHGHRTLRGVVHGPVRVHRGGVLLDGAVGGAVLLRGGRTIAAAT